MTEFYANQLTERIARYGVAVAQLWRGFALTDVPAHDGLVISS